MTKQLDFFHNTIDLVPSEHREREKKAVNQNERILKLFRGSPHKDFTPAEIHLLLGQQCPITSVRRAISDLCKAGDLIKTENKRVGLYGELNCTWKCR